jgi:hypothetical protein
MVDYNQPRIGGIDPIDLQKRVRGYATAAMGFVNENEMQENSLGAWFPFENTDQKEIEFWTRQGAAGVMGVARSAAIPATRPQLMRFQKDLLTDKYAYMLTNEVLESAYDDLGAQDALDATTFFGEAQYWKQVTALKAGYGKTAAAGGYWSATDAESDIVTAVAYLKDYGWKKSWGPILVIYPARVDMGVNESRAIRGSYDTVANIIKQSYPEVEFISYTPFRATGDNLEIDVLAGTSSDALGNDALVVVGNAARVMTSRQYTFKRTPSVFVDTISDEGYLSILHRMNGCKVIPARAATGSATSSPYIYKITGVAASR